MNPEMYPYRNTDFPDEALFDFLYTLLKPLSS
jgi:hypothetical protein